MSDLRNTHGDLFDQIHRLVTARINGELTPEQFDAFDSLLAENEAARRLYVQYIHETLALPQLVGGRSEAVGERSLAAVVQPFPVTPSSSSPSAPLLSSFPLLTGSLAQGWPLAYLVATVVLGIGLLIGAVTHVSQPEQIVRSTPYCPSTASSFSYAVGQISGAAECQFAEDSKTEGLRPKAVVSIGDKFILVSGLLEITYDTGARVILQGPVTYEVESPAGGYLSIGKLTARLDGNAKRGTLNAKLPGSSSSFSIQPSAFVVRTPTAVVTDLGTEFGVEVSKDQLTQVHVLQGSVDAQSIAGHEHVVVQQGRAVRVSLRERKIETVSFTPARFARVLVAPPADSPAERAYIDAVLADRPLGYWPLNERSPTGTFRDRSGHGFHGSAMHKVACGRGGPLGADASAVALDGASYIDIGRHDEFALKNDFTVEAWVRIEKMKPWGCVISATDQERFIGWGLSVTPPATDNGKPSEAIISFVGWCAKGYDFSIPLAEVTADRWVHLAAAFDRSNAAHLYLNGQHRGSLAGDKSAALGPVWVQIGCDIPMEHCWRGGLAHVAVYPRALTDKQIQNHYNQRTKTTAATSK
jgi:hypothetical protein